ncbi:hypothetical protein HOY82DRAFT_624313 [Tuber indicum]|nr:hypothetical protein HOY82DRAFT_624313 [Tuber indicum]
MHAANSTLSLPALYWAISTGDEPMTTFQLQNSTQVLSIRAPTPHPCPEKTLSLILAHGGAIQVEEEATGRTPQHFACKYDTRGPSCSLAYWPLAQRWRQQTMRAGHHCTFRSYRGARTRRVRECCSPTARTSWRGSTPGCSARPCAWSCGGGVEVDGNGNGQTPLHWAAGVGKAGAVEVLLKRGANVGARGGRGMTALHVVARGRFEAVAWLLIRRGAEGTIRDRSGSRVVNILEGRMRPAVLDPE